MRFIADFHIHSKFSRATSKNLDFEHLYIQSQIKGITVLGTADFTHPGWWTEIKAKLTPHSNGLFSLKPEIARACDAEVPTVCHQAVRFMLVTEISNIYKKDGRTRKNHNLVFFPDLGSAEKFRQRLDLIGNIRSDGRPILGLDARDLLEIVLETNDQAYLVPAHIWTPWFSVLGSKSGFDTIGECFGDLTDHIFALETGLSSDPAMNWRFSNLDGFTLISNSDAHSASKLGREANRFDTELDYGSIRQAIQSADPNRFLGTLEFFPEEGKYHLDGHRHCGFRSLPRETTNLKGLCPVCGKPLTIGVLNRVEVLADRDDAYRPPKAVPYEKLIPLESILAEIFQCGANTKRVAQAYGQLVAQFGSEFDILRHVPVDSLRQSTVPLLGDAIHRMRIDQIHFEPGFDGEFGKVSIFNHDERMDLCGQRCLFDVPAVTTHPGPSPELDATESPVSSMENTPPRKPVSTPSPCHPNQPDATFGLNPEQQAVVDYPHGPLVVSAGPGTGKTHTITHRMANLIQKKKVRPDQILAVTFTNKAAKEMRQRLATRLGPAADTMWVTTFHGLGLRLIQEFTPDVSIVVIDDPSRRSLMADVMDLLKMEGTPVRLSADAALQTIISAKQAMIGPHEDPGAVVDPKLLKDFVRVYRRYQDVLHAQGMVDFEDLIFQCVRRLEEDADTCRHLQHRFRHIFVDEFQDINDGQYRLIRRLASAHADICIIGDPDQAIYGFRGSDVAYFHRFGEDYPNAGTVCMTTNYRSSETIIETSFQVIRAGHPDGEPLARPVGMGGDGFPKISLLHASTAKSEAVRIGLLIESLVGGTSFHATDFGKVDHQSEAYSFTDFAVLTRTGEHGRFIAGILTDAGIPCQLAHRRTWMQNKTVATLVGVLRIVFGQATFADLEYVNDVLNPALSREILICFKRWGYTRQLTLAQALDTAARIPIPNMSTLRQQRLVAAVRTIQDLKEATRSMPFAGAAAHVVAHTRLADATDAPLLDQFIELTSTGPDDGGAVCQELALDRDVDFYRHDVEKVAVLTMHAAKGLEFAMVFIAGCEEGWMPYAHPGRAVSDPDEERRLFYVAMTRARERLFFTWAAKRKMAGRFQTRKLSPFAVSIASRWTETLAEDDYKRTQKQLSLF